MRILQLIDTLHPGGAERMAVNLANTLTTEGVDNLLVVSRDQGDLGRLVINQESICLLEKKKATDWRAFKKLLELADYFSPEIVHAHGTSIYWAVALKLFRPKINLIWHDHLGISEEVIEKNPRSEMRWLSSKIDFIITANESTSDYWIDLGLKAKKYINYLPNFPYLNSIIKDKPIEFTFLHLANYRREKGQITLVKAAKILKDRGRHFKVRLVGMTVDPEWKREVENEVERAGMKEYISVEGAVSDIAGLLAEVHAGIVASDREGLPVALLEYGLASLPVVSTRVGQCSKVLDEGRFGALVSPGDQNSLASSMEDLLIDPVNADRIGVSFQDHVKNNYGSRQFMRLYSDILFLLTNSNLRVN